MPGWQRFTEVHANDAFELIAIALEHQGAEAARPYVESAGATFPVLIDADGVLSVRFGLRVVPNGLLIDEMGLLRYAHYGGFDVAVPEHVATVDRFIAVGDPGPSPPTEEPYALGALERELISTTLRLGHALADLDRTDEAVAAWRMALRRDPENLVIRKQIWAVEYPEKFHPAIDWDWQARQLAEERDREISEGICGPDGCPIPLA